MAMGWSPRMNINSRNQVISIVKAKRESVFYFYDDITFFENQPIARIATAPDYLLVGEEIYNGAIVGKHGIRSWFYALKHICSDSLPKYVNPSNKSMLKTGSSHDQVSSFIHKMILPHFLITGHKITDGSIQLGLVMGHLTLKSLSSIFQSINPNCEQKNLLQSNQTTSLSNTKYQSKNENNYTIYNPISSANSSSSITVKSDMIGKNNNKVFNDITFTKKMNLLKKGKFHFVRQLGRYLPFMVQIKEEVKDTDMMVVGGSQEESLDPVFVLFGTRQQDVPVILMELMLPDRFDPVDNAIDDFDDVINLREEIVDCIIEYMGLPVTDESDVC
ncbi:unnamed protein product [Schistosoma curassoni]|uniref:Rho-GAP domain-containing protein n=1 Tax=Schistosoma curassoni TaxID=6186 RepID=A0A183JDI1_9TREM|nr:unnamed protein product [Schistosoma curassoni]